MFVVPVDLSERSTVHAIRPGEEVELREFRGVLPLYPPSSKYALPASELEAGLQPSCEMLRQ